MQLKSIVNTALVGAGGISSELIEALKRLLIRARQLQYWPSETLQAARQVLEQFEPLLAEHIADSVLASWVYGFDDVAGQFPSWLQREFQTTIRRGPPVPPKPPTLYGMFDREPELKLPIIENAIQRLMERNIMTRPQFDAASSSAKAQAFEIAGGLTEDTIERMRGFLVDDMREGSSLSSFKNRVEEHLGTSPIAPGHLENVYRTNIQSAIRDGRETLRENPIVKNTFPYQAYIAVHDARTRHNHKALEKLGLNGTNIYRADDPFWDHFTPPWDYQCRCSTRLLTIEKAAEAGVKEAKEWLKTGRPPLQPEYRLAHIPFEPNPDWGSRGKVGFVLMSLIRMSQYRAPKGYNKANPLMINGKGYVGGEFIPPDEYQKASDEQKKEIKDGKKFEPGATVDLSKIKLSDEQRGLLVSIGKDGRSFPAGQDIMMAGSRKRATQSLIDKGIITRTEANGTVTYKKAIEQSAPIGEKARVFEKVAPRPKPAPATPVSKPPTVPKPAKAKAKRLTNEGNWHYTDNDFFAAGLKAKFRDNMDAIQVLRSLERGQRKATKEEQEVLSKYVGWGQFPALFDTSWYNRDKWGAEQKQLQDALGDDLYEQARASTINAHYTHPSVIEANWKMAKRLGYKGGRYLEPSVGTGYYIGFMPEDIAKNTTTTAVEMDGVSAHIAQQLYPAANVQHSPFQQYPTPDNFYDLVSTNVPFSDKIHIYDPKYKGRRPALHDYFFMRSVDTAKPGGLVMHLTSTGTMDKLDPKVRKYISDRCELVSAIRFPGDTHKENAGTSVVTDMLILRKKHPDIPPVTDETPSEAKPEGEGFTGITVDSLGRLYHWKDGKRVPAPKWDDTLTVPDPDGGQPIRVNRYFAEHPEQVLGRLDRSGTMYGPNRMNVVKTEDYDQRLNEAIDRLPQGAFWADKEVEGKQPEPEAPERIEADQKYAEGQIVEKDGQFYQHFGGGLEPLAVPHTTQERLRQQMALRDIARKLIAADQAGEDATELRSQLNSAYDDFVEKFGPLHSQVNRKLFKVDPDGPFLLALERYNATSKDASKADLFTKATVRQMEKASRADNVADATGIVLNEIGTLDLDRISQLTGKSIEEVTGDLADAGLAFNDPDTGKWVPTAQYLSGDVRRKLEIARTAALSDAAFEANVSALEANLPPDIDYEEIGVQLGAPWIPPKYVSEFAAHVIGGDPEDIPARYVDTTGEWHVDWNNKWASKRDINTSVWGVKDDSGDYAVGFMDILRSALSGRPITIRSTPDSDGKRYVLKDATEQAADKVQELRQQFKDWLWEDEARQVELHRFYNDNYNNIVPTHYDGSHLTLPGMVDWFKPRQMQKDFIWRVITTGRGLAAHEVGTGKTASMIAAAMECRRLGLAKKPCIAVLKSNIEQIVQEAQELYPGAKILSTNDMFTKDKRLQTLNAIATGDYDMVIMTHDHLNAMKVKRETADEFMSEELEELEEAIKAAKAAEAEAGDKKQFRSIVKDLEGRAQGMRESLEAAIKLDAKDEIYFEDSGIDMLMVDEAHHFKSLPCHTKRGQVKGVPTGRSQRATNMLMRTRYLMKKNGGRGVVFCTGTPIANTMAELFNMQRYLQYDTLKERGLHRFDSWADTFGDYVSKTEFKLNGDVSPTTRFSEFVNLPELRNIASDFMDVQLADDQLLPDGSPAIKRPNRHDNVVISPEHDGIRDMMSDIHKRAEEIKQRKGPPEPGQDNMLNVCTDAKKGSIDMRLLDPSAEDHPDSKVNQCVRKVLELYHKHPGTAQCIFSDLGVKDKPQADDPQDDDDQSADTLATIDTGGAGGFSVFGDIKRKLIEGGIPESEIVNFSDDSIKGAKREAAQEGAKRGDVRIMLGSTKRLGTGTNVQKRLRAIHHLDIPWVPANLEQRDGRGYRSGNTNSDIDIYKYVQQGSADNLFWQIVAKKANFINQYIRGRGARSMKDIETDTLSPEQMVAISTGDDSMMERITLEDEVKRLKRQQSRFKSEQVRMQNVLQNAESRRAALTSRLADAERDARHLSSRQDFELKVGETTHTERKAAEVALTEALTKAAHARGTYFRYDETNTPIGHYRGLPLEVDSDGTVHMISPSGHDYKVGPTLRSIEYAARTMQKDDPARYRRFLDQLEQDVAKTQSASNSPWRHEKALAEKEARLTELRNKNSAKLQTMSLAPGQTKVINGVTYTFNEHHRWANQNRQQAPQQQPTQTPNQPAQAAQSQPSSQQPPSAQVIQLAAQEGDSPQHRAARTHVATHFLSTKAQTYDIKTGKMRPLSPGSVQGKLEGMDLSKPVIMGPPPNIPPPNEMIQWQAEGQKRGAFFSVPGASPEHLGIYAHATAWGVQGNPVLPRRQSVYETRTANFDKLSYLFSTAAPTIDTWSVKDSPQPVSGGGPQWYVPAASHPGLRIAEKNGQPTASNPTNGATTQPVTGSGNAGRPQAAQANRGGTTT